MNNSMTHLRMIIADDEQYIRNGLSLLNWESLGIEVCIVSNGVEALELIQNWKPNILMTDIRMPGIDGLKLLEMTKQILPACRFLILTGYADFEYAQKAIEFGASKFILKPADNEALMKTVSKCADDIMAYRNKSFEHECLLEQIRQNHSFEMLLSHLLNGRILSDEEHNFSKAAEQGKTSFSVVVYTLNKPLDAGLYRQVMNEINQNAWYLLNAGDLYCAVYYEEKDITQDIIKYCELSIDLLADKGYIAQAGIGRSVDSLNNINLSYHEAIQAINVFFSKQMMKTISFARIADVINDDKGCPELVSKCIKAIAARNYLQVSNTLTEIKQLYSDVLFVEKHYIKYAYIDLCITAIQVLNNSQTFSIDKIDTDVYNNISNATDIELANRIVQDYLISLIDQTNEAANADDFVDTAINYLEENYSRQMNLNDVANFLHVNAQYLSRKMKQKTGMSFGQLLTNIRLKNACRLMQENKKSLLIIAEESGFSDFRYFGRVFKKEYGLTPSQYRRRIQAGNEKREK